MFSTTSDCTHCCWATELVFTHLNDTHKHTSTQLYILQMGSNWSHLSDKELLNTHIQPQTKTKKSNLTKTITMTIATSVAMNLYRIFYFIFIVSKWLDRDGVSRSRSRSPSKLFSLNMVTNKIYFIYTNSRCFSIFLIRTFLMDIYGGCWRRLDECTFEHQI